MRQNRHFVGAIVVFSAFAVAMPAAGALAGQGRGHGGGHEKKAEKAEKDDNRDENQHENKHENKHDRKVDKHGYKRGDRRETAVIDRDGHVRVIREYGRGGALPPGLAKRQALPPGLQRQLRENGQLPPGLQKRLVAVPAPLASRFPPLPPYYQRYFAGDDLVVVDTRTNRIAALIRDVWR